MYISSYNIFRQWNFKLPTLLNIIEKKIRILRNFQNSIQEYSTLYGSKNRSHINIVFVGKTNKIFKFKKNQENKQICSLN